MTNSRKQRTLTEAITFSGIGLHTGETVHLRFVPAPEHTGVQFKRTDLPDQPIIPAHVDWVRDTSDRCTIIGTNDIRIYTIEHVMAALYANRVDNVIVELSNIEPPIADGSSEPFVQLIRKVGTVEQSATRDILKIDTPVYFSNGNAHLVALPHPSYKISYTLSYPNCNVLKAQYHSLEITPESFSQELSSCRTFCRFEEISALMDRGLIKGGSLDNAVVIHQGAVLSKNGLAHPDEQVRHKMLDIIGDLALVGMDIEAHIIAIRSGHADNYSLAKLLTNTLIHENSA